MAERRRGQAEAASAADRAQRHAQAAWWLVGTFVLSRVAFCLAGVRFDLRPLDTSWHIVDPVLLREDLWRSVFYTPGQPPLYNLMLGAVLKLSRDEAVLAALFRVLFSGMALATVLLLYDLLRRLGLGTRACFALACAFMLSPALVLYESLPYYTLPVILLLTLVVWLFVRMLEVPTEARALGLFSAMAALIYVRSMFQVQWFLVLFAFAWWVVKTERARIIKAALLPLAAVLLLYAKNAAISGHVATSSWLGMSAVKLSVHPLPRALREALVQEGKLSELALRDSTYEPPERHRAIFAGTPKTGIPVLDEPLKSTGHVNYHHLAYVKVSAIALKDALYAMTHYPRAYFGSVAQAFAMFYRPASDYPYLKENRDAIEPWSRFYARFIAGQPVYPKEPWFKLERGQVGYLLVVAHVLCVGWGGVLLVRLFRRRTLSAREFALVFMWLSVVYVTVVGNALEIGENQRFRFYLHPLMICMLATLAQECTGALAKRLGVTAQRSIEQRSSWG